ncbi:MAG: holo-ACP synthase [Verrucomicrobia bacterium]|nr:MAG: holo-ACP synthase [Verrucomicrobiota bacterium]
MVLGIGIDIVEVDRIRGAWERHGNRFMERILVAGELAYCAAQSDPAPSLAARFAAKEAVSKAFGTGIGEKLGWHDIEVVRLASGQPQVRLVGKGEALLAERGAQRIHLSLSHAAAYAAAVAVLES